MPPSLTPEDEVLLGHHLVYEINMLRETYERCPKEGVEISDGVIKNVLIESFCIHARNLIEFFQNEGNYKYKRYSNSQYKSFSIVDDGRITSIKGLLNDQISHLIYRGKQRRIVEKSEQISDDHRAHIFNIVAAEIGRFKIHLGHAYKHIAFPELVPVVVPVNPSQGATTTTSISIAYGIGPTAPPPRGQT
jgi:hypothetical protein